MNDIVHCGNPIFIKLCEENIIYIQNTDNIVIETDHDILYDFISMSKNIDNRIQVERARLDEIYLIPFIDSCDIEIFVITNGTLECRYNRYDSFDLISNFRRTVPSVNAFCIGN